MLTYALIGGVVLLILILLRCLLQQIQYQWVATKATLQVLMALRHPSCSLPQDTMHDWLVVIQKATA